MGFLSPRPRFLTDTYHKELESLIRSKMNREVYDLIIASEIDMTPYASVIKGPAKIFEDVEISQILDPIRSQYKGLKSWRKYLTWWKLSGYLKSVAGTYDGFTVVSQKELQNVSQISQWNGRVKVIPNGAEPVLTVPGGVTPRPDTLIYAGSLTYRANFDAVDYFLRQIFPLIKQKRPGVKFYVTGKLDGVDLSLLPHDEDVTFTGYLQDVARAVAESWVSVVPLRIGGGTRLKILESLALKTPVVSTSKGMEGLDLEPECEILVGDDASTFAAQVLRVLESEALRRSLAQAGYQAVNQKYTWKDIGSEFCAYVENIAARHAGH